MSDWKSVKAENLVRHSSSRGYYLRAKIGGKVIRKSLQTKKLNIAKMKRDDLMLNLRSKAGEITSNTNKMDRNQALALAKGYHAAKPKSMQYRQAI